MIRSEDEDDDDGDEDNNRVEVCREGAESVGVVEG